MTDPTDVVKEIERLQKDVRDFFAAYTSVMGTGGGFAVKSACTALDALRDIALRLAEELKMSEVALNGYIRANLSSAICKACHRLVDTDKGEYGVLADGSVINVIHDTCAGKMLQENARLKAEVADHHKAMGLNPKEPCPCCGVRDE